MGRRTPYRNKDMQQTLLTLGALMIITMTSISQQRSNFIVVEGAYLREQENAAMDYATMRLENIANSKAYDESVAEDADAEIDINTLTAASSFGAESGENTPDLYDDIDDYHGLTESIEHALSADTFRFEVTYSVRYINPSSPSIATTAATLAKELTVDVVSRDTIGHRVAKYSGSKITIGTNN